MSGPGRIKLDDADQQAEVLEHHKAGPRLLAEEAGRRRTRSQD